MGLNDHHCYGGDREQLAVEVKRRLGVEVMVDDLLDLLEEMNYLRDPERRRCWRVEVDDPDMSGRHVFNVESLTGEAACWEGYRQAILEDPLGVGVSFPPGVKMTQADRIAQAESLTLVKEGAAMWATARPILAPDGGKVLVASAAW